MIPLIIIAFLFGAAFGSFGSVVITRLPAEESITGRSRCVRCRHTLAPYDLIPVVSYLLLQGKCRYCDAKISKRYPLLEIGTGSLFAILFATQMDAAPALILGMIIFNYLLVLIAFYDALSQRIPNVLINLLFLTGLFYRCLILSPDALQTGMMGAGALLLFFGIQWLASKGKAIGSGDILLGTCIGLYLGFEGAILSLLFAYVIGATYILFLLLLRKTSFGTHIAFGPFLCIGCILTQWTITPVLRFLPI